MYRHLLLLLIALVFTAFAYSSINLHNTAADQNIQTSFNHKRSETKTPYFTVSSSVFGNYNRVQLELNTKIDFSGVSYSQVFENSFSGGTKYDLHCNNLSPILPDEPTTYFVRARASNNAGASWGEWSNQYWVFTYKPDYMGWHFTTISQFNLAELIETDYGNFLNFNDNETDNIAIDDYIELMEGEYTSALSEADDQVLREGEGLGNIFSPTFYRGGSYNCITVGYYNPNGNKDWHGFRFENYLVPESASITSANFMPVAHQGSSCGASPNHTNELNLVLSGVAQDDCIEWSNSHSEDDGCPRYRHRTANNVVWHVAQNDAWTTGQVLSSPDISSVINEIVNRPGYEIGNAIGIIVDHDYDIGEGPYWRYFATMRSNDDWAARIEATYTNFTNEIRFPNVRLDKYVNYVHWDELIFNHDVSCNDCEIIYEIRNADNNNLIAQGSNSPLSLNSSTAAEVYVVARLNRPASVSSKLFDLTLTAITEFPPEADFTVSDSVICVGECVDFFDLSTNNPHTWYWEFSGADTISSESQNPENICFIEPGFQTVSLIATNDDGSGSIVKTAYINVKALPDVNAQNSGPYCEGESIQLSTTAIVGANYTWSGPESFNSGLAAPTINNSVPENSGEYCVEVTRNECVNIDCTQVIVEDKVVPLFDSFGPYCHNQTPDPLPTNSNNNISGSWVPGSINTSQIGDRQYSFTPSSGECAEIVDIIVSVAEIISPDFEQLGPYCQFQEPDILPNTCQNGISGNWEPSTIQTDTVKTSVYVFHPTEGQCSHTMTMSVVVEENIEPLFVNPGPYCQGETPQDLPETSLNGGITGEWIPPVVDTDTPGDKVHVFSPDDAFCADTVQLVIEVEVLVTPAFSEQGPYCLYDTPAPLPNTSNNNISGSWSPVEVNTQSPGNYYHTFYPSHEFCADIVQILVEVEDLITPFFDEFGIYCQNDTADELPAESNNNISGTWEPSEIDTDNTGTHSYTFTPLAEYCAEESIIRVVVIDYLTPQFTHPGDYCIGDTPIDLPEVSENNISGTWEPSEINTDYEDQIEYVFTPDSDEYLCANSSTLIINVYDYPDLSVWVDNDELQSTEEAYITASGADSYLWTPEGELSCDDCYNPIFTAPDQILEDDTFVFYVYGTSNNCTSMDSVVIKLIKDAEILIPEGFSPNGDGIGDVWEIEGILSYPDNELVVFNRWGNEVFRASPYLNDWEGLNKSGSNLPAGTYYYVLQLNSSEKETYSGYVYIHR